jgi:hypothetical protein
MLNSHSIRIIETDPQLFHPFHLLTQVLREIINKDLGDLSTQDREAIKHVSLAECTPKHPFAEVLMNWLCPDRTGGRSFHSIYSFR